MYIAISCVHTNREEVTEYIEIGSLNGLFVLGRTIGFIGESQRIYLRRIRLFLLSFRSLLGSKAPEARFISASLG